MRWKPHVRFGGRAEETGRPKDPHRASARSNHTHATLALAAGVHPKVVGERLGHATVASTLDVYSHAVPALQEDAAARVASLIFKPTP
jgi:integrase